MSNSNLFEVLIPNLSLWVQSSELTVIGETESTVHVVYDGPKPCSPAPMQAPAPYNAQKGAQVVHNVFAVDKLDVNQYRHCYEMFVVINDHNKTITRSDFKSLVDAQDFVDDNNLQDHHYAASKIVSL